MILLEYSGSIPAWGIASMILIIWDSNVVGPISVPDHWWSQLPGPIRQYDVPLPMNLRPYWYHRNMTGVAPYVEQVNRFQQTAQPNHISPDILHHSTASLAILRVDCVPWWLECNHLATCLQCHLALSWCIWNSSSVRNLFYVGWLSLANDPMKWGLFRILDCCTFNCCHPLSHWQSQLLVQ